ncbi:MAG: DUF2460 domain-containing protein [Chloroflexota bacterium]|nr:DUF2460 domain-containing protein [Chloroflexota bacterium]
MNRHSDSIKCCGHRLAGFTLIEILIVLGVLATITAIAVPSLLTFARSGTDESWRSDQQVLSTAVTAYYQQNSNEVNHYPTMGPWDSSLDFSLTAESLGTGNGTQTVFGPVLMNNTDGTYFRDTTDPANGIGPDDVVVNVNGIDVANDGTIYTIDSITGEVTFLVAVTNGHEILIDYSYGGCYIDMSTMVIDGYVVDVPESASADNGGSGRWSWYIDEQGNVEAHLCSDPSHIGYVEGDPYP